MKWLIPTVLILMALYVASSTRSVLRPGTPAPELVADQWLNVDHAVSLASLRNKVVVVEFWATWCLPCRQSIPHLNRLHDRWKGEDVVIVALTDEPADQVRKFVDDLKIRYIVGTDSLSGFDYAVDSIPHAFVIDGSGQIVWSGYPDSELDGAVAQAHKMRSRS